MFQPKYTVSNRLLSSVFDLSKALAITEVLPLSSDWETRFRDEATLMTIHQVLSFQDLTMNLAQMEKIIKDDPGRDEQPQEIANRLGLVARENEIQEVTNMRNVLRYVDQLVRLGKKTGISNFGEKEMMQMHSLAKERILPSHQLGVYRIEEVNDLVGKRMRHPAVVEVNYQMEDLWHWLERPETRKEIHPLILAGILFYEILRISPFVNGNLEVAVGMVLLEFGRANLNQRRFLNPVSRLLGQKEKTEEILAKLTEFEGLINDWLEFFVESLASDLNTLEQRVRRLAGDVSVKIQSSRQVALSERQMALLQTFQMREELTIAEARQVLPMVSDDTILRDLALLLEKKLIRKKGKTKGARYFLRKS